MGVAKDSSLGLILSLFRKEKTLFRDIHHACPKNAGKKDYLSLKRVTSDLPQKHRKINSSTQKRL